MLMIRLLCIRSSLLFSPINSYWNKADISLWKYRSTFLRRERLWCFPATAVSHATLTILYELYNPPASSHGWMFNQCERGRGRWQAPKMGGFQTGASGLATLCKKSETQGTGKRFKCFQSNFPILSFRCTLRGYEVRGKVTATTMIRPSAHSPTHQKTRRHCWEPWEQWSKQTRNTAFRDTNPGAVLHSGWRAQSTFLLIVPSLES